MKRSLMIVSALFAALVVPVLTASVAAAQTAQISFISVTGNWHDPVDNVPGNQQGQPAITNGVPTSSINWGVTSGSQSGYDFTRKIPGAQTVPPAPTPFFPLGTFTHRNFPIDDPSLTSVQLDVVLMLNVDGIQTGPLKFTFTFNHVETPNDPTPPAVCPYPTPPGEGCTDRVTFVSAPRPTTFNVRGVDYTLSMSFVGSNGNPVAEFITREGRVNTADLVGQFTLPPTTTAPVLTLMKSGPATMNVGQWGNFAIDVQNTGASDAWNASIRDVLPKGATGGMCDLTPEILNARVYAADGVTPVAGKGPLNSGSDYSLSYSAAPNCRLDITMLTAAGRIARNERLIIRYRTQLDSNTQNGAVLTNVAGAIQWFNADTSNPSRTTSTRTLSNGTPGVLDHQDAHSVTVPNSGYFFEKTVADLTSGANPATTAAPGDRLRYTLRFRTSQELSNFRIVDELDALNAQAAFAPGTLMLVSSPAGADISATSNTGGSKGTGVIDIRNLNVAADGDATIQFDINLKSAIANGTVVTNQSALRLANGTVFAMSDDPTVNGAASPTVSGDEDPTRVTIASSSGNSVEPTLVVTKSGPATMNLGQWGDFDIDVQNTGLAGAWNATIRDLLPDGATGGMCDLTPEILSVQVYAADGVTPIPGKGALNSGTGYSVNYSAAPNCQLEITALAAAGTIGPNERLIIRYRTKLDANTQNGVSLTNVAGAIQWFNADSSNPNRKSSTRTLTNGTPGVVDHEDDHTVTVALGAAPNFRVQKISTDLTGDPNVLLAGETLRYTITVKNISKADAVNVVLRDAVPANTTYVANSTTLNGATVADVAGVSPLVNGMLINSPANTTPGSMPADASSNTANVATITFDVVVNVNVANGTVISNQGFVSATANGIVDYPSDDPDTPTLNDPTIDIVGGSSGNSVEPALAVTKSGPATMNLGQWGNFDIDVQNTALSVAWNATVRDMLPKGATGGMCDLTPEILSVQVFAADGVTPIPGKSALNSGTGYSLSYSAAPNCQLEITMLTAEGTIDANERLIIRYRTQLDATTQNGVTLTNVAGAIQWFNADSSNPNRKSSTRTLTNGTPGIIDHEDDHTVTVALGAVPNFRVQKISTDMTGDPNVLLPDETLRYTITVKNIGSADAVDVMLRDVVPANTTYVVGSATLNGKAVADVAGVSPLVNSMRINSPANTTPGLMPADASSSPANVATITFDVVVNPNVANGTVISNQGFVTAVDSGIVDQPSDDPDTPILNDPTLDIVGSVPGPGVPSSGTLSGSAWHDADFNDVRDSRERALSGWTVELYRDNQLWKSVPTDANGDYRITDVDPNDQTAVRYELRFHAPGTGANTAMLGRAASQFTNGLQRITNIVVTPGANLQALNLPIDPNGIVYNSVLRTPVAGVTLNLLDARSGSPLPAACFDDAAQQGQITLADGYYKFDINFGDPACPSGVDYLIGITAPQGTNYVTGYSQIIPPASTASSAAFSLPACPSSGADAIPGTALYCEVQPSEFPPAASVPARSAGTSYHVHLMLDSTQMPGTSQIFNNHIALDPLITGSLSISKTTPLLNVSRGQLVPYVITVKNPAGLMLTDVSIVDRLPLGFSYVQGSALLDGVPAEPSVAVGVLGWNGLTIAGTETRTLKLLVAVGAGVSEGEYVNRAQVMSGAIAGAVSAEATATVRLMPDITFDCTDVTGKVFNDDNRNGLQDNGEEGLVGVRVVTPRGLQATTDKYGRYHISCAITPNESRGSNFVLKLDDRTLPSGFRTSTDLVQIKRATRGKTLQLNFGASIHRVVGIDVSDAVFEPGKTDIREQWRPRLDRLLQELAKGPAVLRLSYVADTEDASLVERRVEAVKRQLTESWGAANSSYTLTIEPEVFWRRGGPPKRPDIRVAKKPEL